MIPFVSERPMQIEWADTDKMHWIGHNELPYLPFPSCWPVYSPAPKVRLVVTGLYLTIIESSGPLSVWRLAGILCPSVGIKCMDFRSRGEGGQGRERAVERHRSSRRTQRNGEDPSPHTRRHCVWADWEPQRATL